MKVKVIFNDQARRHVVKVQRFPSMGETDCPRVRVAAGELAATSGTSGARARHFVSSRESPEGRQ
jgi:hypothetical protein